MIKHKFLQYSMNPIINRRVEHNPTKNRWELIKRKFQQRFNEPRHKSNDQTQAHMRKDQRRYKSYNYVNPHEKTLDKMQNNVIRSGFQGDQKH